MDDRILNLACSWLASRTFRTNCSDYGYKCPSAGAFITEWPAQINDWIPELIANVPALLSCPDTYIRDDPILPIVRVSPAIPRDVISEQITGWVMLSLDLDKSGEVARARITSSTSPRLEGPALEAARKFRYRKKLENNRFVEVKSVTATIHFDYWDLAKAAGCSMHDE